MQSRSLLTRALALSGTQALTWALSLAWVVVVPRSIGVSAFGELAFVTGLFTVGSALGLWGLDVHIARAVARADTKAHVRASLVLALTGTTVATTALTVCAALVVGASVAIVFGIGYAGQAVGNLAFAVLQGKERPGLRAGADVAAKVVFVAGSLLAARSSHSLLGLAIAFAAGYLAYAACGWRVVARDRDLVRGRVERAEVTAAARATAPLGAHLLAQAVYYRADAALLPPLAGTAAAGSYGAAYRMFDTLSFVTNIYAALVSPRLARLAREAPAAGAALLRRSVVAMGILGVLATIGTVVLAGPVVRLLFGPAYGGAVLPLQVLAPALGLGFVVTPLAWALVAADGQHWLARISGTAAALNVAVNLVTIPLWGATGAAAATLLTEVVVLAGHVHFVRRTSLWAPRGADNAAGIGQHYSERMRTNTAAAHW